MPSPIYPRDAYSLRLDEMLRLLVEPLVPNHAVVSGTSYYVRHNKSADGSFMIPAPPAPGMYSVEVRDAQERIVHISMIEVLHASAPLPTAIVIER